MKLNYIEFHYFYDVNQWEVPLKPKVGASFEKGLGSRKQ